MATATYHKATRRYTDTDAAAVDALDLEIADGEFLVLVGPSGSGKSTALRMLAGLEEVNSGSIHISGRDVTHVEPKQRDIAMVFQSYALYPHMTVGENMAFALKLRKLSKSRITAKVAEAARLLDLLPYLDRKPKALSGGQRQRVAMGRAIVREPSVFLMDEPLSNLDTKLRVETRANIAALQRRLNTTTVYVTHDQVEAMTLGDRVAVMRDGKLQQCAPPRELFDRPVNAFVAGFIGSPAMNLTKVPLRDGDAVLDAAVLPLPRTAIRGLSEVLLGVRPEQLRLAPDTANGLAMAVELVEDLGADCYVYGEVRIADRIERFIVRTESGNAPKIGQTVTLAPPRPGDVHLFHPTTGERLPGN
jgi:multiple sugar transport system ATP-binding protein